MIDFFKNILTANNPLSSKRFTQLYSLLLMTLVIIFSIIGIFYGKIESDVISTILYILAGIVTGQSILTVVQNNSLNKTETKTDDKEETI